MNRMCKCAHDVGEHKLVALNGSCRACPCLNFRSIDGSAEAQFEQWKRRWERRFRSPAFWFTMAALIVVAMWWFDTFIELAGRDGWFLAIFRTFGFAMASMYVGRWLQRGWQKFIKLGERREYDRLQEERQRKASK